MSGPNPPGPESERVEPGVEPSQSGGEVDGADTEFGAGAGESDAEGQTGQTDVYSRAYSAPESEHISSGPYVPANLDLYDYDTYDDDAAPHEAEASTARWPWIVGIAAIVAAIALVVSVSLLFARAGPAPRPRAARTGDPAGGRRAQAIHLFGDRHQGAVRPDHDHLHRCLGDAADAVQRIHPVDDHADTDLSVRRRFDRGVQLAAVEQTQLQGHC